MSTGTVLEHARNPSQEDKPDNIKVTKESTCPSDAMEIPRILAANSERGSDSFSQGKRSGMILKSEMTYLEESKYDSDDSHEEEIYSHNYVWTSSAKDGSSHSTGVRPYTPSFSLPIIASHNATHVPPTRDSKDTTQFSRPTKSTSMQIGNSKSASSSVSQQKTVLELATESGLIGRGFEAIQSQSENADLHPSAAVIRHKTTFDENPSLIRHEPHKSASPNSDMSKFLDEHSMNNQLEHEPCFSIRSWSKVDASQATETEKTAILEDIDSVPAELYAMFDKNWLAHTTQYTNRSSATQSATSQSQSSRGEKTSAATVDEDHGSSDGKSTDEDESGEDVPEKRRRGPASSDNLAHRPRLACPFYKNDPQFFGNNSNGGIFRSCAGPGFVYISRLKEHLYRVHKAPILNCPPCRVHFKSQEKLNEHHRSERCPLRPPVQYIPLKFIPKKIKDTLKNKKRSSRGSADRGRADRWREIYQLIFPNEPIPSPYYEASEASSPTSSEFTEIEDYESFSNRELPGVFEHALEVALQGFDLQLQEQLKCLLLPKLSECQKQVSSMYHNSQQAAGASIRGTDMASVSTPKACFVFEPRPNAEGYNSTDFTIPGISSAASLSWCPPYGTHSNAYQQVQHPPESPTTQRISIESIGQAHHLGSGDSGCSTNSVCFSNCSGQCICYDYSDPRRRSFDIAARVANFPDATRLLQDSYDPSMDTSQCQIDILTSFPWTSHNPNPNYLPLQ